MIPVGHRVIVIASSNKKSGANIRRGSTGFIVGNNLFGSIDKLKCLYLITEVVFTRFGMEQKERCEKKPVIILFPCYPVGQITKYRKHLNRLTKNAVDYMDVFRSKFTEGLRRRKNIDIIIVSSAPVDISENLNEMKGWFYSAVASNIFQRAVFSYKKDEHSAYLNRCLNEIPDKAQLFKTSCSHYSRSKELAEDFFYYRKKNEPIYKMMTAMLTLEIMRKSNDFDKMFTSPGTRINLNLIKSIQWSIPYYGFKVNKYLKSIIDRHTKEEFDVVEWVKIFERLS
jgi:hypothetical protein